MKIKKEKYDYYYNNSTIIKKTSACGPTWLLEKNKFSYLFPIITVCYILTEDGIVGRGVSVYNKQDEHAETIGKSFARQYALRAIKGRPLDNFKRKEVIDLLIQCKCPFTKKGERNPDLSWWERRFLFGAKKMHSYIDGIGFIEFMTAGERGAAAGIKLKLGIQKFFTLKARSTWFDKNYFSRLYHYPIKTINTEKLEKAIKDLSDRGRLRL